MVQPRDHEQQVPLPVGRPRPAPGEEVGVQFPLDLDPRDGPLPPRVDSLNERVVYLPADELDEVRVAAGHVDDPVYGGVTQTNRTVGSGQRPANRFRALVPGQAAQEPDSEHPLGEGARLHQLGKQGRKTGQDQHQRKPLALQRLEGIEQHRQGILLSRRLIAEVLRLVIGKHDAAHAAAFPGQRAPCQLQHCLDLVEGQAGGLSVMVHQGVIAERVFDLLRGGCESGAAHLLGRRDQVRGQRGQIGAQPDRHAVLADAGGLRHVGTDPGPPAFERQRLERVEQHRLPHSAKSGQKQVFQNGALAEQTDQLTALGAPPGQIGRRVARARTEWVGELDHGNVDLRTGIWRNLYPRVISVNWIGCAWWRSGRSLKRRRPRAFGTGRGRSGHAGRSGRSGSGGGAGRRSR